MKSGSLQTGSKELDVSVLVSSDLLEDAVDTGVASFSEGSVVELLKSWQIESAKVSVEKLESSSAKGLTLGVEGVFKVLENESELEDGSIVG